MKHIHSRLRARLTAIFLCVLLAAAAMPAGAAFAAADFEIDAEGRLTGYSGAGGEIIIPDQINGIAVREIGEEAFAFAGRSITRAVIPEGVTAIGRRAFAEQEALVEVILPGTLQAIGEEAFSGCSGLAAIDLPDGLKTIGSGAFENCSRITGIAIPGSIDQMGDYIFRGADALKEYLFEGHRPITLVTRPGGSFKAEAGVTAYVPEECWKEYVILRSMLTAIEWKMYTPDQRPVIATAEPVVTQAPTEKPAAATQAPQAEPLKPRKTPMVEVRENRVRQGAVVWFTVQAEPSQRISMYINGVKSENSTFSMGNTGVQDYACSFSDMGCMKIQFGYDDGLMSEPVALTVVSGEKMSFGESAVWNNYTYVVFDEEMEWESANTFCRAMGAFMLEIDSAEKQKFIEQLLSCSGESEAYWIGVQEMDGQYAYATRRMLSYSNWEGSGEFNAPDDHAEIYRAENGGYLWRPADGLNAENHGFICEFAPHALGMLGYEDVIGEVTLSVDMGDEAFSAAVETRLSARDGQTYVDLQEAVMAVGGSYDERDGLVEFGLQTADGRVFTGSFMRKSVMPGAEFDVMIWNEGNEMTLPVTRQGVKQKLSIKLDDLLMITGCDVWAE